MKKNGILKPFLILLLLLPCGLLAQLGKNGAGGISGTVTNINEYTTLSADASSGNTSITVTSNTLNSGGYYAASLSAGDLIMIIQMQGATLNATNDSTWGAVTAINNAGNYEFAEVQSVSGSTTINLNCGLTNGYTAAGRVQVIRVPRLSSLTINSGATLGCTAWNGATGGVLAVEVSGNTIINSTGKIDASGKGFRGAQLLENLTTYGIGDFAWLTGDRGAEKGEGIGGYEADYDTYGGRYGKGAAANGGGGGNAHNGGGGGGGNGGNLASWSGKGNPDVSTASWITAWNLEYSGFASSSSTGGGKGGYTFSDNNQNALTVSPNNSAWGGDDRDNNGGLGGRPMDYSGGRLFMGGGGGSGDQNDNVGGPGGNGGGLIYIMSYGAVSGSGLVLSNGSNGSNTKTGGLDGGIDGAGGAGAGGTIIINSMGSITGISATANGGNGGSQTVSLIFDGDEAEGPGGGGSGGYIAISNGSITRTANGGTNGTTNSNAVSEFPPNGATKGGSGTTNASVSNFSLAASGDTICSGSTANLIASVTGTLPGGTTIYWFDSQYGGSVVGSGTTFTTPALSATITYYVGACPGTYRLPVNVVVQSLPPTPTITMSTDEDTLFCNTNGVYISWQWYRNSLIMTGDTNSYVVIMNDNADFTVVVKSSSGCSNSTVYSNRSLPIELLSFEAIYNPQSKVVDLNWSTLSEINNDFFTIEKTKDETAFIPVAYIKGAGNSTVLLNYYAVDEAPLPGIAAYRLKQTDFDGRFHYSSLVAVDVNATGKLQILGLSKNGYEGSVQYVLLSPGAKPSNIEITDMLGKIIVMKNAVDPVGMIDFSGITHGLYMFRVFNDKESVIQKLIY